MTFITRHSRNLKLWGIEVSRRVNRAWTEIKEACGKPWSSQFRGFRNCLSSRVRVEYEALCGGASSVTEQIRLWLDEHCPPSPIRQVIVG